MTEQNPLENNSGKTRKDFEVELVGKAWNDEKFREQLISNPKEVIEQEFGQELPEEMNVEIIQEPLNALYIVLPAKPENDSDELDDEELEDIAGGRSRRTKGLASRIIAGSVVAYGAPSW